MPDEKDVVDLGSDMENVMADIQSRTESGSEPGAAVSPSPTPAVPPAPADAPAAPTAAPTSTTEPWRKRPDAWAAELEPDWTGLPPKVMEYIHKREKQQLEGISKYKSVADQWDQTLQPFNPVLQHYGIDPHEAFTSLANAHLMLTLGTPEQRAEIAQKIIKDYNLQQFLNAPEGQPVKPDPRDETIREMHARLQALETGINQTAEAETRAQTEAFFSNPENEFAHEVVNDMIDLVKGGLASTLKEAYETAIWRNPAVRQKLLQREVEKVAKPSNVHPLNVKSSNTPAAPTESGEETIDDTMRETLNRIVNR